MFKELYKQNLDIVSQQKRRRQELLAKQKRNRVEQQDERRELPEIEPPRRYIPNRNYRQLPFKVAYDSGRQLQLSEWLRERPEQLEDWLLVPCPRGQRCMVVACRGRTEMYTKKGYRLFSFRSMLPGDGVSRGAITMLDCVYAPAPVDTFYVLDALAYNNTDLVDCEAQFRFFWLRSKFEENDDEDLSEVSARNEKRFCLLNQHDFENAESVSVAMQRYPVWPENRPELDGFLFYHKEANYTFGATPLVGWLFAFMVPDVLGLHVSDAYERPADYKEPLDYINAFDDTLKGMRKQRKHDQRQRQSAASAMEVEERFEDALDEQEPSLCKLLGAEQQLELEGLVADDVEREEKEEPHTGPMDKC